MLKLLCGSEEKTACISWAVFPLFWKISLSYDKNLYYQLSGFIYKLHTRYCVTSSFTFREMLFCDKKVQCKAFLVLYLDSISFLTSFGSSDPTFYCCYIFHFVDELILLFCILACPLHPLFHFVFLYHRLWHTCLILSEKSYMELQEKRRRYKLVLLPPKG